LDAYFNLSQWLTENAGTFLSPNKTAQLRGGEFKDIKKFVVLWPNKHPSSRIQTDDFKFEPFYGDVIGFDELVSRVCDHRWQSANTVPFEPGEMVELARALRCEPPEEGNAQVPGPNSPPKRGTLPIDPARQPEQSEARKSERVGGSAKEEDSMQAPNSPTNQRPRKKPSVEKPGPKVSSVPIGWVLALVGMFVALFLFVGILDFNEPMKPHVERTTLGVEDPPSRGLKPAPFSKAPPGTYQRPVFVIESVRTYRERWIYLNARDSDLAIEISGISPNELASRKKYYDNFIGKKVQVDGKKGVDRLGRPQITVRDSEADSRLRVLG
jgi:hypothetical protein